MSLILDHRLSEDLARLSASLEERMCERKGLLLGRLFRYSAVEASYRLLISRTPS